MRLSIRQQILIPLGAVQVLTVVVIALVAARLAVAQVEIQAFGRLEGVVETLARSNFPLTGGVLEKMRGLSGAQFVTAEESGRVLEATLPGLATLPPQLRSVPRSLRFDLARDSPRLDLGGERYLVASIRSGSGPVLLILYPEAAWRRAWWEASLPPLVVGLVSLVPMALVTSLVAHRLGSRLGTIRGQVAAIAAGNFGELATPEQGDEVDGLVGSVNRMATQLRRMRLTIHRTERAGVLAQLAAGLAHQLRNACTGARLAVQLHARRCPASEADGSLDVALRQLSLCEEQVKRLLASGRSENEPTIRLDPAELLLEVARLVEPTCRHLGVTLLHEAQPGRVVEAEQGALRAAVLNLALNAIEATGSGGQVDLIVRLDGPWIEFEVVDDGPGPAAEIASDLFEPFVSGKPEGLGLGLALAHRVALDLGGELSWNRDEGRTCFRLKVPRPSGEADAEETPA